MARVGIIFGLLLCGLTFVGMVGTPIKSPTQFIPMMLGIPILFSGVVALNPHRRKHSMHAASAVAFLGAVAGAAWSIYCLVDLADVNLDGLKLVVAMTILCAFFLAICVTSFVMMRKRKMVGEAAASRQQINLHQPPDRENTVPGVNSRESA